MFKRRLEEMGLRVPKMGTSAITGSVVLPLLVLLALGGLYERWHISSDLRRALLVAVAPDTPESLVKESLQRSKAHLHTWRDRQEFNKLQRTVDAQAAARASELQLGGRLKQARTELDAEIHSEQLMIVTERAYLNSHQPMPAGLADDVAREQQRRERARDQQRREDESAWLQLLQQRLDARVLMQQLRVDLGMALPSVQR